MQNVQWRQRVIFVLIDGLSDSMAKRMLGYMEGLVEQRGAMRAKVRSILPSLSRPCYATIFTGQQPGHHGITTNDQTQRIAEDSVFDLLAKNHRTSAVAGYHWMSELFSRGPFEFVRDREQEGNPQGITSGRFYFEDGYPDSHVFADAERLRRVNDPDLLVIHPMGCDDAGHRHGAASREYAASAGQIDFLLAKLVPLWQSEGYHIVVTSDHGMDEYGFHGGTEESMRMSPLYVLNPQINPRGEVVEELLQTQMAGFLCQLLDVSPSETMMPLDHLFQDLFFKS